MNQNGQQNGCDYQNSFYSNGFHDMGAHGHVVSNMNLTNVTSPQSGNVYGNGTNNHIAKDQCQSTSSLCNLKSTIIDNNESERLSESSESGIGEENTESSSTNSSPNGKLSVKISDFFKFFFIGKNSEKKISKNFFSANDSNVWKHRNFNDCCLQ